MTQSDPFGAMFVHSFSGGIISTRTDEFPVVKIERGGVDFEVEPPIRLAKPTWRPIPQLDSAAVKRIFSVDVKEEHIMRLAAAPTTQKDGQVGIQLIWGDNQDNIVLAVDTIITFAHGKGAYTHGDRIVSELMEECFEWLRTTTEQWWVGRPIESLGGNLHSVLELKGYREAVGLLEGRVRVTTADEKTIPATPDIWRDAWANVAKGLKPKAPRRLLSEALFFLASRQFRAGFTILCSAFEVARDEFLARRGASKKRLSGPDLLKHISDDFWKIANRDLSREDPQLFAFVKSCWIARGHLSHGGDLVWFRHGQREHKEPRLHEVAAPARSVVSWFEAL